MFKLEGECAAHVYVCLFVAAAYLANMYITISGQEMRKAK